MEQNRILLVYPKTCLCGIEEKSGDIQYVCSQVKVIAKICTIRS